MGKNLRTKTFQSLLEAIHVLQSNEEVRILQCIEFNSYLSILYTYVYVCVYVQVSRVVQVVDIDVDGVISSCELRAWLFPKTLEDYMSTQICLVTNLCIYVCMIELKFYAR